MILYLDQTTNSFNGIIGSGPVVTTARFKARDTVGLDVRFHDGLTAVDPAGTLQLVFILKTGVATDATTLAIATTWSRMATGHYRALLSLNTETVVEAIGDLSSISASGELSWSADGTAWESSSTLTVTIQNDIYKGTEGTPLELSTPEAWLIEKLHAATGKATPVDADEIPLVDSAASWGLKKLTWANLKATAKTYFDTLYASVLGADDNYVTDAEKTKLSNLSGTNTGDQDMSGYLPLAGGTMTGQLVMGENLIEASGSQVDVFGGTLTAPGSGVALSWSNRTLIDGAGQPVVSWDSGVLVGDGTGLTGLATSAQGALADSASQPGHTHVSADVTDLNIALSAYLPLVGGALSGNLDMGSENITNASNVTGENVYGEAGNFNIIMDRSGSGPVFFPYGITGYQPTDGTLALGGFSGITGTIAISNIGGLGTGVGTALAVNLGSSGAFVTNGGALGTPLSGTLTSCTGLPISTGVLGLGTTVASTLANAIDTASGFITQSASDTRYGQTYFLRVASTTSATSTAFVDHGSTVTIPAGTYEFDGSAFGLTASTTAGIQIEVIPSNLSADTTAGMYIRGTANTLSGGSATASTVVRVGSNGFQFICATLVDGGASNLAAWSRFSGTVAFSVDQTIKFRIKQRTTTDASNPAVLQIGSYIKFVKR